MAIDYRRILGGLIMELSSNERIVVEDAELGEGLPAKRVTEISQQNDVVLPASIVDFFTQVNGAIVSWRLAPGAAAGLNLRRDADRDSIQGRASFHTLGKLLTEWTSLPGTPYEEGLSERARLQAFRPFDKNVEEAFAGFMVAKGRVVDNMVYLRQYHDIVSLEANLSRYVRALVECKAFLWWQDAYAARPGGRTKADLYHYVPQLFPGSTLPSFR